VKDVVAADRIIITAAGLEALTERLTHGLASGRSEAQAAGAVSVD
jgi:hypothetical protein